MKVISGLLLATTLAAMTGSAIALEPRSGVTLRALDKITGNSTDLESRVGDEIQFGRLQITVRACYQAPPEDTPESAAFLEVSTTTPEDRERLPGNVDDNVGEGAAQREAGEIFSGWMFASSPGLNALDHPTYDVWVISCRTS